mmetsp:Transcript_99885/g.286990  ORF Transcript_99885/g.286990 Transcript_99885/m.286990 type:complete len:359 (+) Transcript_99885:92-1168(+)
MGVCGSARSHPGLALPRNAEGKCAVQAISIWSLKDSSLGFRAEKKTSRMPKNLSGIGFACRRGRKPGAETPNQDSWCFYRQPGKISAYGVFDGHGANGHIVSDYVMQSLAQKVVLAAGMQSGKLSSTMHAYFQQVQQTLASKPSLGTEMSGTTATVVLHDHELKRLICSHVGDSTAVLLKRTSTSDRLVAESLTRDHRPDLPEERKRIEKYGRVVFDGYCHRVVAKASMAPGLNMSRSFGDVLGHSAGVSSEPDVVHRAVTPEDRVLVVCSDGIWKVMSPQDAADIVQDFGPLRVMEAARALADAAMKLWLGGTRGRKADDITVLLAWIPASHQSPGSSQGETCCTETGLMISTDSGA